jgi:dynein assembly factor 1
LFNLRALGIRIFAIEMTTTELDRQLHATVLKREEAKERAFRDERARQEEEFHSNIGMGGTEMTKQELRKIIDSDRRMYYRTVELNDKLYMHYKGWRELKNLDDWTGLKTIYAECNAFSEITGLQNCRQMRSLFLQENCIKRISGLENMPELWSLNLSSNFIERIEGLEGCHGLNTLIIAKNKIGFGGIADLDKLADSNICSVDLQDNRIDDPDVVPEVFMRMKNLRVLYLKGNPASKKIVNYRKSLTVYCKDLRYLDDRPVFEDDRRNAEAFNRGGIEEQRAETKRIREEKNAKHERNMQLFQEMIENSRLQKRERDAMRAEDQFTDETDPVESFERRAKRLQDQWKEEHADELKDDAKEHAEKCLRAEREKESREGIEKEASDEKKADDERKATTESRDTAAECGDTGAADSLPVDPKKEDNRKLVYEDIWDGAAQVAPAPKKKEDNRKLVYEDIWDDAPPAASASAPRATASAAKVSAAPVSSPKSLGPSSDSGIFMPWADGAMGMDAITPSPEVMEKRKAALQEKAADGGEAGEAAFKPSWHSRYQEQIAKGTAKLAPQAAVFAPPSRTAQPSADAVLPPASKPDPVGAGELDEMD